MSVPSLSDLPAPPDDRSGWPWTEQSDPLPETQPDGSPWPKISIVTPSYNQGQFIEETIRSILLQRYPNLEYIVMDGGSDDNTIEILEKYDPWIDHWVSEPDDGQAQAINDGLAIATGEIRAYLNSDDYYFPGAFAHVARTFQQSDATLFCGTVKTSKGDLRRPPTSESLEDWIERTVSFPQPGCFWKQADVIPSFDPSLDCTFDRKFFMQLLLRSINIVQSDQVIAVYRVHPDAKTSTLSFLDENRRVDREISREADGIQRDRLEKSIRIRNARYRLHHQASSAGELLRIARDCPQMLQRREFYGRMKRLISQM